MTSLMSAASLHVVACMTARAMRTCGPDPSAPDAQPIVQDIAIAQLQAGRPDLLDHALQAQVRLVLSDLFRPGFCQPCSCNAGQQRQ